MNIAHIGQIKLSQVTELQITKFASVFFSKENSAQPNASERGTGGLLPKRCKEGAREMNPALQGHRNWFKIIKELYNIT